MKTYLNADFSHTVCAKLSKKESCKLHSVLVSSLKRAEKSHKLVHNFMTAPKLPCPMQATVASFSFPCLSTQTLTTQKH